MSLFAHKKTVQATDRIYGFQAVTQPTFDETLKVFSPVRDNINALRGDVMTVRGYPVFLDHKGELSRIDEAMLGWIELWEKLAPDLDQRAQKRLHRKLLNGVPIVESDLDAALVEVGRQQARFMVLPIDEIWSKSTDQLIAIELDALGLRRAA